MIFFKDIKKDGLSSRPSFWVFDLKVRLSRLYFFSSTVGTGGTAGTEGTAGAGGIG